MNDDTARGGNVTSKGADGVYDNEKGISPEQTELDYKPAPYEEENKSAFRVGQGKLQHPLCLCRQQQAAPHFWGSFRLAPFDN